MPISLLGFIVGRLAAERQDLPPEGVNRAALIGAALGSTPVGVVATSEFVRREAPEITAVPSGLGLVTGKPAAQPGAGQPTPTANSAYIPNYVELKILQPPKAI